MLSPEQQWRDEMFRRLPDGSYERVDGVVPRVELERAIEALRKERQASELLRRQGNLMAQLQTLIAELRDRK